jgi:hypothetical protein
MAKKKKKKPTVKHASPQKTAPDSRGPSKLPLLLLSIGAVLLVIGGFYLYKGGPSKPESRRQNIQTANAQSGLHETRATLPPSMFSGRVREAYAIAQDIPEVLDQLYCYCRCKENFGHKNLLSCYVDNHAST